MSVLVLDSTTKSIEAFLAGSPQAVQPPFVTAWADNNGTTFTEGELDGALNSTTAVTIVAAPAAGYRRIVRNIIIYNADTASITVTIRLNNNGTYRILYKQTISPGDTLDWPSGITAYGIDPTLYALLTTAITDSDTTHSPDGNTIFDALALKANLITPALSFKYDGVADAARTNTTLTADWIVSFTSLTATRDYQISSEDIAVSGRMFIVKDGSGKAATFPITISTEGAETIDGAATISIDSNYGSVTLYSNGSNLFVV